MFSTSDLLRRNLLVFRATVPPNAHLRVLGERGVEIGRVVEEETGLQDGQVWLAVYDRENTRVLAVEKGEYDSDGDRMNPIVIIDGRGQPVTKGRDWRGWFRDASGQRIGTIKKKKGPSFVRGFRGPFVTIHEPTRREVGNFALGRPPDGDVQLGFTYVLTITADITAELRLVALGWAITRTEGRSRSGRSLWMLKRLARVGVAWPGCVDVPAGGR